jgi:hypothetical protein
MGYRIPDDPPDADLTPEQLHDRIDEVTNLTADELRAFKGSDFNQDYNRVKSDAAQPGDEPLDDVIQLLETPASEYRDMDDGFNEIEEGRELLSFQRRTQAQIASQGLGENYLTDLEVMQVREAASIRWGIDPDEEREWL